MKPEDFFNKHPDELTAQELSFIHLDTSSYVYNLKDSRTRSMLSFTVEAIRRSMNNDRTRHVIPIMSMMCILDQLGICYDSTERVSPRFGNGIKRALYFFGGYDEADDIISVLYGLRNGLLHNISLCSKNKFDSNENFYFRWGNITGNVYVPAKVKWDGNYETLDTEDNVTLIDIDELNNLVSKCLKKAETLNNENKLIIRLNGGMRELFYSYLRTIAK